MKYIPFSPSNYDYFETDENSIYHVKYTDDGQQEFVLYRNSAESNRLDKTEYLTIVGTVFGVYRDDTSIINMSVKIEYPELIDFNYIYIPNINRYYFVIDIMLMSNKIYELNLQCDVLMTYKEAIKACSGFIDRNEFTHDPLIIDDKRVIEQGVDIDDIAITNNLFGDEISFVLNGFAIKHDTLEG